MFSAAVVEVLFGALVDTLPHRRWPQVALCTGGGGAGRGVCASATHTVLSGGMCLGVVIWRRAG